MCNFIKIVTLGTGGIKCASGAIIRFHNGLWLGEFRTLDPCISVWESCSGEMFCLCNPRLLGALVTDSDAFRDRVGGMLNRCVV